MTEITTAPPVYTDSRPRRHFLPVLGLTMLAVGGYVAGSPLFTALPVSPILAGALITLVALVVRRRNERVPLVSLTPIFVLWLTFLVGAVLTAPTSYGTEKTGQLYSLTLLSVAGGATLLQSRHARVWWLHLTVAMAGLVSALIFLQPDLLVAEMQRLSIEGSNTIAAGRAPAAAVVVLTVLALGRTRGRWFFAFGAMAFSILMLGAGSRGPLAAAIVAIGITAVLRRKGGGKAWGLVVMAALFYTWQWAGERDLVSSRMYELAGTSTDARLDMLRTTGAQAVSNPIGSGWGSVEGLLEGSWAGILGHRYPHNIFMEVAAESGWLALVAMLLVLVVAFRRQWHASAGNAHEMALFALLVFFVASAMVSGDINSHRAMWVLIGAALVARPGGLDTSPRRSAWRPRMSSGDAVHPSRRFTDDNTKKPSAT